MFNKLYCVSVINSNGNLVPSLVDNFLSQMSVMYNNLPGIDLEYRQNVT